MSLAGSRRLFFVSRIPEFQPFPANPGEPTTRWLLARKKATLQQDGLPVVLTGIEPVT